MKKIIKLITAIVATACMSTAVASAQSGCTITGTGQNSSNVCEFNNTSSTTYRCQNGVLVNVQNGQQANSGNATTSGNTGGGSATSGNALNEGQTTTNVNSTCASAASSASNNTPMSGPSGTTSNPTGGRGGAGSPSATGPNVSSHVTSLPATGSTTTFQVLSILAALVGSAAVIYQLTVNVYRRRSLSQI